MQDVRLRASPAEKLWFAPEILMNEGRCMSEAVDGTAIIS